MRMEKAYRSERSLLAGLFLLALMLAWHGPQKAAAAGSNAVGEFVCAIKDSGGDYATLGAWESSVQCDLTSLTTKVFRWDAQGSAGIPPDGVQVRKASDPSVTATCVHATGIYSGQILLKNISGGTFEDNDVVERTTDANFSVTLSDGGQSAIAVAECYNALNESVTVSGWTSNAANHIKITTYDGGTLSLNGNLTISGPDEYVLLGSDTAVTNLTVNDGATLKVPGDKTVTAANDVSVGTNGSSADTARIIAGGAITVLEDHSLPPAWYDQNWTHSQKFTIDQTKVDEHLTDFPVLVALDPANTDIFGVALSNGDDILLTASDGVTKLDHEIERYIDTAGQEQLIVHVRIPLVDSGERLVVEDYSPPPAWYDAGWQYCQKLTLDHTKVDEDLTNFPVVIRLRSDESEVFGKAQSDADDILFTASDGVTKLNHETEKYVDTPGAGELVAHVAIPTLSSGQDTVVYMYFGNDSAESQENPSGVWDTNYEAVWHLSEDPSGPILDSTSNGNDGTSVGSMTSDDQVRGKVDGSLNFDGSDDYVEAPNLNLTSELTLAAWVSTGSVVDWQCILERGDASSIGWHFYVNQGNRLYTNLGGEAFYSESGTLTSNRWHYVVAAWNGTEAVHYVDGEPVGSSALTTLDTDGTKTALGTRLQGGPTLTFNGTIDEVRISDTARSPAWIKASYHSQKHSLLVRGSKQSATTFYMYYGNSGASNQENPEGVWDRHYGGVWHLSEDPTATLYDSTSNGNNGASAGGMTSDDQVEGRVDGSLDFDGTDDIVQTTLNINQGGAYGATMEAWVYPTSSSAGRHHVVSSDNGGYDWSLLREGPLWYLFTGENSRSTGLTVDLNTWQHVVAVFDPARGTKFYKDGVEVDIPYISTDWNDNNIGIGKNPGANEYFAGQIDEVRVSSVARSSG